jgi:hypothetical protein
MISSGTQAWMTIQDRSQEFRWLERNGKLVLQVACPFQDQHAGGFEWRDIPVVKEGEK